MILSYQWHGYEVQFTGRVDVRGIITAPLLIGKVAPVYEELFNVGPRLCSYVSGADYFALPSS